MGTIRFLVVSKFKRGITTDRNDKCSEGKSTSKMTENVDSVKELGHDSRRITTCAIANMLRISLESQEEYHVSMRQDLQEGLERDMEFFSKTGTGDVTWIERYNPQITQESPL
jgi:hypothetical protein